MTANMKLMISEGLLIWAFSCAINGYTAAAAGIGVLTLAADLTFFTKKKIMRHRRAILLSAFIQVCAVRICGLGAHMPVIGVLACVSALHAVMWNTANPEAVQNVMHALLGTMTGFYTLAMLIPNTQFSFAEMIVHLSVIYLPLCGRYMVRTVSAEFGVRKKIEEKAMLQ